MNGHTPPASEVAAWVGLRDRYQLARVLRHDGLPPLEQLVGWTRVLHWILEAEQGSASLRKLAHRERVDPAVAYRMVQRLTGLRWSQARRGGVGLALLRLRARCTPRSDDAAHARAGIAPGGRAPPPPALSAPPRVASRGHPQGALAARLSVGGTPFDVAVTAGGLGLATCLHAAAVRLFRLDPLRSVGVIPVGAAPTRVIASPAGDHAFVTSQFAEEIGILDLRAGRQVGAVPVPGHPLGAALAPDGSTLYVSTNLDRLCVVSLTTGRVIASTPVPMASPKLAVHPSGQWVYASCWRAGVIVELETRTLRPTRTFPVRGTAQGVALSADGGRLYAANEGGWLDVIHVSTGRRAATLGLEAGGFGIALSPDEAVLFVSLLSAGRVAVVDTRTLRVREAIRTEGRPTFIAFDRTGRTAAIANECGWVDLVR